MQLRLGKEAGVTGEKAGESDLKQHEVMVWTELCSKSNGALVEVIEGRACLVSASLCGPGWSLSLPPQAPPRPPLLHAQLISALHFFVICARDRTQAPDIA